MVNSPSFVYQTQIEEGEDEDEDENAITFPRSINIPSITEEFRLNPDCPRCCRNQRMTHLSSSRDNACHNCSPPPSHSSESGVRGRNKSTSQRKEGRKGEKKNEKSDSSSSTAEEMLKILRYLIWRQDLEDQHNRIVHEWRLLALAIDKVLFWVFLVITVISSLSFLVIIPIQRRGFGFGFA